MPVQLPQSTRLQRHDRRCDGFGDGKIARINYCQGTSTARRRGYLFLGQFVDVGAIAFELSIWAGHRGVSDVAFDNIWIWCRDGIKHGFVDSKVLGQD